MEEGEEPDFLQLYLPLRQLFSKTTTISRANCARIQKINCLGVLQSLSDRFYLWHDDPLEFWERLVRKLPRYSDQKTEDRARIFLQGAAHLDAQIEDERILRRFVAVSAYRLFRRAFPTSQARIVTKNVEQFLNLVRLPSSTNDIEIYAGILRRGQKHAFFCKKVEQSQHSNEYTCSNNVNQHLDGEADDYGPLPFSAIPDSM